MLAVTELVGGLAGATPAPHVPIFVCYKSLEIELNFVANYGIWSQLSWRIT
jgi:hypothetical protein